MNKQSFFEKVLSDCTSNEEKAVRLLQLMGFFIHKVDGNYYLSDNASYEEAQELEKLFNTYSLGETRYKDPPRVINEERPSGICPPDKSIIDMSFSVSANSISSMIKECFKPDRRGGEAGAHAMEWSAFLSGRMPKKVTAYCLEPFIAYYVKAVSACGVETFFSCDGNHENGGKIICRSNYPSSIFHKLIWSDACKKFDIEGDIEDGISFNKDNQYDLYYKIFQAAQYLYENRARYREREYGKKRKSQLKNNTRTGFVKRWD